MKTVAIACVASVLALTSARAEDSAANEVLRQNEALPQRELMLPTSTGDCIKVFERVMQRTLAADLLDDQIDEAEDRFENFETACIDGRFDDALEQAKSIERLIAMNR